MSGFFAVCVGMCVCVHCVHVCILKTVMSGNDQMNKEGLSLESDLCRLFIAGLD